MKVTLYFSMRGNVLAFDSYRMIHCPILTVEMVSKWYYLCLVHPDNPMPEELSFGRLESFASPHAVDHCPNPKAVEAYAHDKGYLLDDIGFDLIVGRWRREVKEIW